MHRTKILVVDDDPQLGHFFVNILEPVKYDVTVCDNCVAALNHLEQKSFDLVLSDIVMPDHDGYYLLDVIKQKHSGLAVVMMTAYADVQSAVKAMKMGAFDYLTKPFEPEKLRLTIQRTIDHQKMSTEIINLRKELKEKYSHKHMVGKSPAMMETYRFIEKIAPTDATVLIQGETGTGKELVARAIHYNSKRDTKPFVKINCAALNETLIESELFGHEKGAFTGAAGTKQGLFEFANGGTVFLDEIGEMPLNIQVKLLQVLEHGIFRRIGSNQENATDTRLIAATNRNLLEEVEKKRFRSDLYHRLNVMAINVPPLRERKEDIPLLVLHFFNLLNNNATFKPAISKDFMSALDNYNWPGNVRELHNVVERALLLSNGKDITPDNLPPSITIPLGNKSNDEDAKPVMMCEMEKQHIIKALKYYQNNRAKTAGALGITPVTLRSKIKEYNIDPSN